MTLKREGSADEHLAIRLQRDRINFPIHSVAGIEAEVQRSVHIEPRDIGPADAIYGSEVTVVLVLFFRH